MVWSFYALFRDPLLLFVFMPIFFGGIFIFGIYLLMEKLFDARTAFYCAVMFSFSFVYFRLYLDLVANFIAWAFVPYAFYAISELKKTKKYFSQWHALSMFLLFMILLSHVWGGMIFLAIIILDSLFILLRNYKQFLRSYLILYMSLIVVLPAMLCFNPYVYTSLLKAWHPFVSLDYQFQYVNRENLIILFLGVLGAWYIIKNFNSRNSIIFTWYAFVSFLLIICAYRYPYRLLLLFPTGILAGLGLQYLETMKPIARFSFKNINIFSLLIVVLTIASSLIPSPIAYKYYQGSYLADHVATPSKEALDQLLWIRSHFGWNNSSVLFIIGKEVKPANNCGYSNFYYWTAALVGTNYFSGYLFDVLQGLPRRRFSAKFVEGYYGGYLVAPDLSNLTVLFASEWYSLSALELAVCDEIGPGIYKLRTTNISEIFTVAKSVARAYSSNFTCGFSVVAGWGNYYWSYNLSDGVVFYFSPAKAGEWLCLEFDLLDILGLHWGVHYLLFNISACLPKDITLLLQFSSSDRVLEEFDISYIANYSRPLILQFPAPSNVPIRFVRFCIRVDFADAVGKWYCIQISDFVLL
ncbi:hypothetical protein DRN86_05380 [Candidatus Geothermarchaeota archaeon]|nr:MAG: hypothetical protein DRN86_05380 [Candidatus Geothermarchaeota archaeon]